MTLGDMHPAMLTGCLTFSTPWPTLGNRKWQSMSEIRWGPLLHPSLWGSPSLTSLSGPCPTSLWRMMDRLLGTGVGWKGWPT